MENDEFYWFKRKTQDNVLYYARGDIIYGKVVHNLGSHFVAFDVSGDEEKPIGSAINLDSAKRLIEQVKWKT